MKKILLVLVGLIFVMFIGLYGFVSLTWDKEYDAPYPDIHASTDSAMIARGGYLVNGAGHCTTCHIPMDKMEAAEKGEPMQLVGGWELDIPPGVFRAPNLTPDMETGIGSRTDAELARTLRYSVNHKNRMVFPFMPFQMMSDYDLASIISYLRAQPAVRNEIKPTELSFMGKAIAAFGLLKPTFPSSEPPKNVAMDTTVEYGSYIANNVGNCAGCHTERDMKTGEFIGPKFAGGFAMPPDEFSKGYAFVTPNLTPDPETGIMASWTEEAFVARLKAGRVHAGSAMPWGWFGRMDEVEMRAVYRYLSTLEPVKRKIPKIVFAPGEEVPEKPYE
jgi:mono/diheme cytochrome c family protein